MGWIGELSSIVLSMGQKLINGAERCNSDSNSEIFKLDLVNEQYRPSDSALIEQLYKPVEPSDLISKQQTTMIYLASS